MTDDLLKLRSGHGFVLCCILALFAMSLWLKIFAKQELYVGLLCAVSLGIGFYGWVYVKRTRVAQQWGLIWAPRKAHLIQCFAQGVVYLGWCTHSEMAYRNLPLVFAQVLFAYLIDLCSVWRKQAIYQLGFGPIPIVLSTNLFLFFKDEYYIWQWPMIACAILSKNLFRWKNTYGNVHIFNPSAIALSLVAIVLIFTESMSSSWGEEIALSHATSPWSYELIFGAGLLVSILFGVGPTIISATLITLALGHLFYQQTGTYRYLDTGIPAAVFLGMNLLITDPATSPKNILGKVIYGGLYGLSVFILYGLLRGIERPPMGDDPGVSAAFCDKLLAVPLLNLMTPSIEHFTRYVEMQTPKTIKFLVEARLLRWGVISLWILGFVIWIRPQLRAHPGRSLSVWLKACDETPLPRRNRFACANRDRIYRQLCDQGDLHSCHNLALSWEQGEGGFVNLSLAGELYQQACQGGKMLSCHHLGGLYVIEAEKTEDGSWIQKALPVLERACHEKIWGACSRLAALKLSRWTKDDLRQEAWNLWERACEHNEPFACFEIGQRSLQPLPLRIQRCLEGDALSCRSVERTQNYLEKNTVQNPLSQARQELMKACQGEIWVACANVSWMMWRGDGGPQLLDQAMKLMKQSCIGGLQNACERMRSMRNQNPQDRP